MLQIWQHQCREQWQWFNVLVTRATYHNCNLSPITVWSLSPDVRPGHDSTAATDPHHHHHHRDYPDLYYSCQSVSTLRPRVKSCNGMTSWNTRSKKVTTVNLNEFYHCFYDLIWQIVYKNISLIWWICKLLPTMIWKCSGKKNYQNVGEKTFYGKLYWMDRRTSNISIETLLCCLFYLPSFLLRSY